MATPEETRERIKKMRERIFETSSEVSVKNDSQETPQKSSSNENKTNNSQSKKVQIKEVEPTSSFEDVPTEKVQQQDDKASFSRADIRNISSAEKNKDSILDKEINKRFEQTLAESDTKIKKVEDLVNDSIAQASEINTALKERLEELNKSFLLELNSIEQKCSSKNLKIETDLQNCSDELSNVKNSIENKHNSLEQDVFEKIRQNNEN